MLWSRMVRKCIQNSQKILWMGTSAFFFLQVVSVGHWKRKSHVMRHVLLGVSGFKKQNFCPSANNFLLLFREPACCVLTGGRTSSVIAWGTLQLLPNFVCVVSFRVCWPTDRRKPPCLFFFFSVNTGQHNFFVQCSRKKALSPPPPPPPPAPPPLSDCRVDHTTWELTGSHACKIP